MEAITQADVTALNARIAYLERQLREVKESFIDRAALAAITGVANGLTFPSETVAEDAFRMAEALWARKRGEV